MLIKVGGLKYPFGIMLYSSPNCRQIVVKIRLTCVLILCQIIIRLCHLTLFKMSFSLFSMSISKWKSLCLISAPTVQNLQLIVVDVGFLLYFSIPFLFGQTLN